MENSELTEFSFIDKYSKVVELPTFLEGDFGKVINEKVQAKYSNLESINKVIYDNKNKIIKGSNPFS